MVEQIYHAGLHGKRGDQRNATEIILLGGRAHDLHVYPSIFQLHVEIGPDATLEIDDIRILIAHEFGHVLGLGHCHDCDSAMNYSYNSLGRVIVTELDALTFAALVQQPNGFRVDGQPLASLAEILQAEDREP